MTRKDFVLIAATVRRLQISDECRTQAAREFALVLSAGNPRFEFERFMVACGAA